MDLDEELNLLQHLKQNHDMIEEDEPIFEIPNSFSGEYVTETITTTISKECVICFEDFRVGKKFLFLFIIFILFEYSF